MPDTDMQTPQWLSQKENILEELNEGVGIADEQLRVIFVNESLARLWPVLFCRLHLRQHFVRMSRRFNIGSHGPLPIVWAHPSVEGEPIEVTDSPKETRGVHN
jgi:hypothetical protein